jgi:paraquat-inducible protein A
VPAITHGFRATCTRCRTTLASPAQSARSLSRTAAIAVAALALYPAAMLLPVIRIEQFGHAQATSILGGTIDLLSHGHIGIGIVILVCSVVVPLAKLFTLLTLVIGPAVLRHHHRALAHHLLEWTGRWGMLDVLAVAVVVAALKLGDLVEVTPGPGAIAFAGVVALSLLASASFNPHLAWPPPPPPEGGPGT